METVKIDSQEAGVRGNQHSTVWPEVGAICPNNIQSEQPPSIGALGLSKTCF